MTATEVRPAPAPPRAESRFRPDIEGLRAVAVVLVVLGHAGVTGFAGGYVGVDVFFVISGFLITSLLLRELTTTGRISIRRFYARRAMRLLPASTLVLVTALLASWWWLTPLRTGEYAGDAAASAFSAINLRLALTGTDYLAADATPSPFQHFWSLAVEEQFYLVWPLLILLVCLRLRRRWVLVLVLAALCAGSYALSVRQTQASAPWAYFGPHTRAWELGVGALLAVVLPRLRRLPGPVAAVLGWAGLAAVAYAAVAFDDTTAFPGSVAAIPVLGAAAVIAAGADRPGHGVPAVLSAAPLQFIGRLSYGWYLWHWPVLMIAPTALRIESTVWTNLALGAGSLILAWITFRLVENPMRHRRTYGIALGLALSGTVALVAVTVATFPVAVPVGARTSDLQTAVEAAKEPAKTIAGFVGQNQDGRTLPANLTPPLEQAGTDTPLVYPDGCHVEAEATTTPGDCVYGDPSSPTTVVLFGDSHAAQWFPAMQRLAGEHHWRLVSLTKSACTAADVPIVHDTLKRTYTECQTWHRATVSRIAAMRPAMVVVASSFAYDVAVPGADVSTEWRAGWDRTIGAFRTVGAAVTLIADTPYMRGRAPACLSQWAHDISHCGRAKQSALHGPEQRKIFLGYADSTLPTARTDVTVVDPTPWMCADVCSPVLGNVLVYRDSNHMTTVFSRTLAPLLDARLPTLN